MGSLSRNARIYIFSMIVAGAALVSWQLPLIARGYPWWLFVVALLAAIAQVLKVEGATVRSNYNAGLAAYAFALLALGLPAALAVMLAACVIDWVWHKYPWYIQSFNIAVMALALAAAEFTRWLTALTLDAYQVGEVVAAVAASLAFVALNHLAVAGVLRLARRENLRESGVFGRLPLVIDGALFALGAVTGALWSTSPYVVILAVVPLYPIYLALRVPSLERQVVVDSKTGLFNSQHFNKELARELERAHRFDRPLTVVLGDLDLLRNINNTFGHLAGDVVLITVAAILKESVREYDVVARFGGEEFAILMPETTKEDALAHIDQIRRHIAASGFDVSTSVDPIKATMSFGIAGRTGPGESATQLMHQADLAVYRAKLEGRNKVCMSEGKDDTFVPFLSAPAETGVSVPANGGPANGNDSVPPLPTDVSGAGGAATEAPLDSVSEAERKQDVLTDPRHSVGEDRAPLSSRAVNVRLAATGMLALVAFGLTFLLLPNVAMPVVGLQLGTELFVLALVALATEFLAIEIYARDTSISTSGAVLMAGAVLIGPIAVLLLSALVAGAALVKNHSPFSRFMFNTSIHALAGLISFGAVVLIVTPRSAPGHWLFVVACLVSASVYFALTTFSVAWAISWTGGASARRVWNDRFRWLAPYYVALGLAAYGLVFGYVAAGPLGVLVIVTPLMLLRFGQRQYVNRTKSIVSELRLVNQGLKTQAEQVSHLNEELLMVVAKAVDARDPDVVDHSQQVARYAVLIADGMGISGPQRELVRKAGLLHDIGKLGIPESILFKPARLSPSEYRTVKEHSSLGAQILSQSSTLRDVVPLVLHHHEHYDGRGYPDGLKERDIPLEARIISVADAVAAMASDRPYRHGMHPESILAEIRAHSGTQFDPVAVAAFCNAVEALGAGVIVNSGIRRSHAARVAMPTS